MKRLFSGTLLGALVLGLTACSTPKLAVPKLALVSVAMTSADIFNQQFLRQMVEPSNLNLHFVSHNEVPAGTKVMSLGVIR